MSTQAQGVRGPSLRGYRRRKAMLDLNVAPIENRDQEGTSSLDADHGPQANPHGQQQNVLLAAIDVEALDDDVIESSPRAFARAKSNAQRNHPHRTRGGTVLVDVDSGRTTRLTHTQNKRRRVSPNHMTINYDQFVNLESSNSSVRENIQPQPPPPPKEPIFKCPICMGPFVDEMSTKCGHIFCKECIKTAVKVQSKCPTCRKKVTAKELIRVFLPATTSS